LAIEAAWRAGAASARPFLPEGHRFGAWRAPRRRGDVADADRAGAQALLRRYHDWSGEAARRHMWRGTPQDAALVLESFPPLWAAWLVLEDAPAAPGVPALAQALATGAPVLTEETVELWLQRRAALLWCDVEGLGALLGRYHAGLRPFLAHYAALRRPPAPAERARLIALAEQHGETAALDLLPA
uniref:hypothetical protein n=1 Tax=Falsiroseomonas oryzae TaxID=2766473 RepID=UPI0022EABF4E